MFLIAFPLLLIPFALYNMVVFLLDMPISDLLFTLALPSGGRMAVSIGDLLVVVAMLLLYVEFLKAARFRSKAIMDHVLSLILFAAMASEFTLVPKAATPTFLLLTVLGFVDLITGVSVGLRAKPHGIVLEDADQARV